MMQNFASANNIKAFPIVSASGQLPDVEDVGLKGQNLMRMARIGLPVPDGFVIGAHACEECISRRNLPDKLIQVIRNRLQNLENSTGLRFGGRRPLLVSVRSSAAVSMPGMMATVLDIGLCDSTASEMIRMTGNPGVVWDSYRRLIEAYAEVIRSYGGRRFDDISRQYLDLEHVERVAELDAMSMRKLVRDYLKAFKDETGEPFPQEPMNQLLESVKAVFNSWESPKASAYRTLQSIRGFRGTAVIVERMVYGNMGATSGSGVAFTRNPATGEKQLYLDFLFNAQGEDVVSGIRSLHGTERLNLVLPKVYSELQSIGSTLELEFKDMQDLEFTVQEGKLFVLQCRDGKRTSWAQVKIAVDLASEGVIDRETALSRLNGLNLDSIERTIVVRTPGVQPVARGIPAGHGVAVGRLAIDSENAKRMSESGASVILVRDAISTSDVSAMAICSGVLTALGGRTSHAALLARQMDKVCVVGCMSLSSISTEKRTLTIASKVVHEGDYISVDGNTGDVYLGSVTISRERPPEIGIAKSWAERRRNDVSSESWTGR
jgi:pyruvate, orthophosphate dikinase